MLAFLGDERWRCAISGGTGKDEVGKRVLADLESYGVNTHHVAREDLPTRVRCILGHSGAHGEWDQLESRPSQLKFKPRWIGELPGAANLLLARANKTINNLAARRKAERPKGRKADGTRIIAHVSDVPRRYPEEFKNLLAMLALADIVFAKAEVWRDLLKAPSTIHPLFSVAQSASRRAPT